MSGGLLRSHWVEDVWPQVALFGFGSVEVVCVVQVEIVDCCVLCLRLSLHEIVDFVGKQNFFVIMRECFLALGP